jgi:hypothetical protein
VQAHLGETGVAWETTACHFPIRFTQTSVHTQVPLVSFPWKVLFLSAAERLVLSDPR